jgi:prophage regulatory protein
VSDRALEGLISEHCTPSGRASGYKVSSTILRLPQVKGRVGLSRSSIYLAVSKGTFPRPISLGARAIGWLDSEVEAWLSGRIEQTRGHAQ